MHGQIRPVVAAGLQLFPKGFRLAPGDESVQGRHVQDDAVVDVRIIAHGHAGFILHLDDVGDGLAKVFDLLIELLQGLAFAAGLALCHTFQRRHLAAEVADSLVDMIELGINIDALQFVERVAVDAFVKEVKAVGFFPGLQQPVDGPLAVHFQMVLAEKVALEEAAEFVAVGHVSADERSGDFRGLFVAEEQDQSLLQTRWQVIGMAGIEDHDAIGIGKAAELVFQGFGKGVFALFVLIADRKVAGDLAEFLIADSERAGDNIVFVDDGRAQLAFTSGLEPAHEDAECILEPGIGQLKALLGPLPVMVGKDFIDRIRMIARGEADLFEIQIARLAAAFLFLAPRFFILDGVFFALQRLFGDVLF